MRYVSFSQRRGWRFQFLGYGTTWNATQVLALRPSLFFPLSLYCKKRVVVWCVLVMLQDMDVLRFLYWWYLQIYGMTGPYRGTDKWVVGFESEAWAGFKTSPRGICGRLSGTGRGYTPSSSVFLRQYHSFNAPYSNFILRRHTV